MNIVKCLISDNEDYHMRRGSKACRVSEIIAKLQELKIDYEIVHLDYGDYRFILEDERVVTIDLKNSYEELEKNLLSRDHGRFRTECKKYVDEAIKAIEAGKPKPKFCLLMCKDRYRDRDGRVVFPEKAEDLERLHECDLLKAADWDIDEPELVKRYGGKIMTMMLLDLKVLSDISIYFCSYKNVWDGILSILQE